MRILIVEDATDMAEAIVMRLARSGMACDLAKTVAEAEGYLAVQSYDAVVLDTNLPDGLCTALLRDLRNKGERTPALMPTPLVSVDDRVSAIDLGGDDHLVNRSINVSWRHGFGHCCGARRIRKAMCLRLRN